MISPIWKIFNSFHKLFLLNWSPYSVNDASLRHYRGMMLHPEIGKKKPGKYLTFKEGGDPELSNLLKHFYMVVDLYDYIAENT